MRLKELAGIRLDKLDMKNNRVLVKGKGDHEREAPFGPSTALYLDRFLRARDKWLQEGRRGRYARAGLLWIGEKGPMTESGIAQMIQRRAIDANRRGLSAHAFRRGAAVVLVQRNMARPLIKRLLGWKSDAMIERYIADATTELAHEAFRANSPVETLDED
jgi:site-specific recombinase XerD